MVNTRAWFAEAIATFGLVFFGPLSVILAVVVFGDGSLSTDAIIMISLGHGGAIALMVYAFILFQIIGAVIATATLAVIFPEIGKQVLWGAHGGPSDIINGSVISAVVLEIIFTFFLVVVIFMTAVHKKAPKSVYGAAIGGMVFLLHLVGVPLTGASMNPARSFSPALISGDAGLWEVQWIYWVGPIIGGIIAGALMTYIYTNKAEKEE